MGVSIEAISIENPNHYPRASYGFRAVYASSSSMRFRRVSIAAPPIKVAAAKGLGVGLHFPDRRKSFNRSTVVLAASHEESKPSEIDIEPECGDVKARAKESEEAWKQTLAAFREQALKMQNVSQEAYEKYYKRAIAILKQTSEQLKIEAEKARKDLTVVAKELSEDGKEYLTKATENSPEVKEIVEIFASSTYDVKDISKIRDFCFGIPYGLLLTLGGFLSFMVTSSIPAIRFGVILGGTLLALSISSLRSYKRGEISSLALKGQAAIASIIFLREIRLLSQRLMFPNFLITIVSGTMVAFYIYRITADGKWGEAPNSGYSTRN